MLNSQASVIGFRAGIALLGAVTFGMMLADADGPLEARFVGVETNSAGRLEYYFAVENDAWPGLLRAELRVNEMNGLARNPLRPQHSLGSGARIITRFVAPADAAWHVRFYFFRSRPAGLALKLHQLLMSLPFYKRDGFVTIDTEVFGGTSDRTDLTQFERAKHPETIARFD